MFQDANVIRLLAANTSSDTDAVAETLTVWLGNRRVGHLELPDMIEMRPVTRPSGNLVEVDARLIIEDPSLAPGSTSTQTQQPRPSTSATDSAAIPSPKNDSGPSRKRKAGSADTETPAKRPKMVAQDAKPIAKKSSSQYANAAREPIGLTKRESDSCLTCLRYSRRCKGTIVVIVNGHKRCQCCANPGKGTAGRVCYWYNPEEGIYTYEDGQRLLAKKLGGRVLKKNTRQGRQKRQRRSVRQNSTQYVPDDDEEKDGRSTEDHVGEQHVENDSPPDESLQRAAETAHDLLRTVVALDLHLPPNSQSDMIRLAVERGLRDAFGGIGPHQQHLRPISTGVLQSIPALVESEIAEIEAGMRHERGEDEQE